MDERDQLRDSYNNLSLLIFKRVDSDINHLEGGEMVRSGWILDI